MKQDQQLREKLISHLKGTASFYNMAGRVCRTYWDYACLTEQLSKAIEVEPENFYYYSGRGNFKGRMVNMKQPFPIS